MSDEKKEDIGKQIAFMFAFFILPSVLGAMILWGPGGGLLAFPASMAVGCVLMKFV
jgi:hypothetical protein